ncbi:glycosyltransferase [Dyella sp. KULCS107]|uniref:glycosyltransferase n=1 Tax=Dyella sp. KULCS107 TaxID=3422216 RepID=UPI003D6FADFA
MNQPPLVSIALATFNGEEYLDLQLNSVLDQDYPNFEIVISDDGSTDATWTILEKYATQDERIRLLPHRDNVGVVQNFARCFAACQGELISPCDQDDIWHPDKTRRLIEAMGNATLVYCNSQLIDDSGQPIGATLADSVNMIHGSDPRPFIFSNSVLGHAMIFRRGILQDHGALSKVAHDWWLAFVASNLGHIAYLDEVLVDYRRHGASITHVAAKNRSATQRMSRLAEDSLRLTAMAEFPGKHQRYVRGIRNSWTAWHESHFNISMFLTVLRDGATTHKAFLKKKSTFRLALKYLVGHRLKRLLRPKYYPE